MELPKECKFTNSARIIQIDSVLLVFAFGAKDSNGVGVYSLDVSNPYKVSVTVKKPLQRKTGIAGVALYNQEIAYLTGGQQNSAKRCSTYDIKKDEWYKAPSLNMGRTGHASCCFSEQVFVFGG